MLNAQTLCGLLVAGTCNSVCSLQLYVYVCILWQSLQAWLCRAINKKEEISIEQAFHFSTNDDSVTEIGWGCVLKETAI